MAKFASNYLSEVVLSYLCLLQFKLSTVFSFHNIDYYTENKNNWERHRYISLEMYSFEQSFFRAYKDTTTDVDSNHVYFNGLIFMVDFCISDYATFFLILKPNL